MSVRQIVEVRQRMGEDPTVSRELGFFIDTSMAEQVIDACYRQAWGEMMASDFVPSAWFPAEMRNAIAVQGFDRWWADDRKSGAALFYRVNHELWNQVPSNMSNFKFTMEGSALPL